jgi:pyruvate,orthophosphate dikinase
VRLETSPDDIQGMHVASGILTARGGMTSHAAVVARGMNRCCIAGCKELRVERGRAVISTPHGEVELREGDWLSLNGSSGKAYAGRMRVVTPKLQGEFSEFLGVADSVRTMDVYANCDTPEDAKTALDFGAQGIGLVRTEHMFFSGRRIRAMREMILALDRAGRERALAKLLPFQREDFYGILKVMSGRPVVIRLIDPPLHEFLPRADEAEEIRALASDLRVSEMAVLQKIADLHEENPMLGFRGCRLGIVYPEITRMQVQAIFEASLRLAEEGLFPVPHIEVPLVGHVEEFLPLRAVAHAVARELGAVGVIPYQIGTMIEVPRAALTADELAPHADFLSFGTNDLTQMTCGFSRDDAGSFLGVYAQKSIYPRDPFQSLDGSGVAKLMNLCCQLSRSANPHINIGICGEHGGDPVSITICQRLGSPYRIPLARLAAAQAAVQYGKSASVFFTSKL